MKQTNRCIENKYKDIKKILRRIGLEVLSVTAPLWGEMRWQIPEKLQIAMEDLGFVPLSAAEGRQIFISKERGVIVKKAYLSGSFREKRELFKKPKGAIPTVMFPRHNGVIAGVQPLEGKIQDYVWMVQPIADVGYDAVEEAMIARASDENYFGTDAHNGNLGLWNGQPVTFDW
jgi:hypothetical protein